MDSSNGDSAGVPFDTLHDMSTRIVALALGLRGSISFLAGRRSPGLDEDVLAWGPAVEAAFDAGVEAVLGHPMVVASHRRTEVPASAWQIALHAQLQRLIEPRMTGAPSSFRRQLTCIGLQELLELTARAQGDFRHSLTPSETELIEHARSLAGLGHALALIDAGQRLEEMDGQLRLLRQSEALEIGGVIEPSLCGVDAVIERARGLLRSLANRKSVDLRNQIRDRDVSVLVDAAMFERTIVALLENGIKYNFRDAQRTWVSIYTKSRGGRVTVSIQNWGVRIEDEDIRSNAVFRAGYRGTAARRERAGTGFGLWGVGRFIEQHNGTIKLTSVPAHQHGSDEQRRQGPHKTTVVLELPVATSSRTHRS